jgi:hypothetical protein
MIRTIRSLRNPSPGACLDDLLASRFLPRRWATRLWSASELPYRLERCARSLVPNCEWRAYGDQDRILFAIARAHSAGPQAGSAAAIDVYFLDENASVYAAGVWVNEPKHGWWLDSLLDLSYDCEYGWWLDVLIDPQWGIDLCDQAPGPDTHELRTLAARSPACIMPAALPRSVKRRSGQ